MNFHFLKPVAFAIAMLIFLVNAGAAYSQSNCCVCDCECQKPVQISEGYDCCPDCYQKYQQQQQLVPTTPRSMSSTPWIMPAQPAPAAPMVPGPTTSPRMNFSDSPATQPRSIQPAPLTGNSVLGTPLAQPGLSQPGFSQPGFSQPLGSGFSTPAPAASGFGDSFGGGVNLSLGDSGAGASIGTGSGISAGLAAAGVAAATAGSGADGAGLAAAASLTSASRDLAEGLSDGEAPNMIGDFLNGLTTGAALRTTIAVDYESQRNDRLFTGSNAAAQAQAVFNSRNAARISRITNGFAGETEGIGTVIEGIPGLLEEGQGGSFDTDFDLSGDNQGLRPQVRGDINPVAGNPNGETVTTTQDTFTRTTTTSEITASVDEPFSEAQLLDIANEEAANQGLDISDELGEFGQFVTIQYLADESFYRNRLSTVTDVVGSPVVQDTVAVSEQEAYRFAYEISLGLPSANPGEFIGRANFTDNTSPIPRDRVWFDYNFFHNARIGPAQIPMNRFTPGFEKTFNNENMSFEVRVPMAVTLASTLTEGSDDVLAYELGDVAFALKALLYRNKRAALAVGTGVTVPTANDFTARVADGTDVISIENRSVRITPYIGGLRTNGNSFLQGFVSADIAAAGNRVFFDQGAFDSVFDDFATSTGLAEIGTLQSSNLIKVDVSAGRWLRRNQSQRRITDIAGVLEGHLVSTLNDVDSIETGRLTFGELEQATVFNITAGAHLYFGQKNVLTVGYGVPVTEDRFFDGEFRATWNRYF